MRQSDFGFSESKPSPVVSLSIFDKNSIENGKILPNSKLLVVVRSKETNIKHPNVISVPTQRIPLALLNDLTREATISKEDNSLTYYDMPLSDNSIVSGHDPIVFIVESILSKKLGLANSLEMGEFIFSARLRVKKVGKSFHPNLPLDNGQIEYITMLNAMVLVNNGKAFFPKRTPSYSHIFWSEAENFTKTVKDKNPLQLNNELDPIEYCIHGLCISSTYSLIADDFGIDPNLEFFT